MDDGDLWTLYRSFLAVLRAGSLSGAAREMGTSQPTLGRHIVALEERLGGAPLFTRSARGLTPTETARAIRPHVEAMAASASAIARTLSGPEAAVEGVVRITASEIVGGMVLPPILAALRERHPRLAVELSLSNRTEDVLGRAVDIAVRMVKPSQKALLARRIGAVPLGLYAHRAYVERHGLPRSRADLARHAAIGYDRETAFVKLAAARLGLDRAGFALRTDSDLAALSALRAGFGIGVCQAPLARRLGDLTHVMADEVAFELPIWIVMHEDLKRARRIRAAFDHLAAGMKAYLAGEAAGP